MVAAFPPHNKNGQQANMATMVTLELECTFPSCDRGDGAHYKTPKLASGLALALLLKHRAETHPPPASN